MKKKFLVLLLLLFILVINSCTNLEEQYDGNITADKVKKENIENLINSLNTSLKVAFQNPFGDVIGLSEITTDELICPTRGGNWSDNGIWRQLHQHKWGPDHTLITGCFNDLGGIVFAATNILQFNPSPEQKAKVRFYRALAMYWMLDFFDQVPYRDPGESTLIPARVRKGLDALNYIIAEINDLIKDLPDGPVSEPNKNAAKVFLMKCHLNKGVYANRQAPSFDLTDMNNVIKLADEVIASNQYQFSANYFDNFAPDNATIGKENIFTQENQTDNPDGINLLYYQVFPMYYTSTPGGFNGFTTLSDFYDKFKAGDLRKEQVYVYPNSLYTNPGNRINLGFLIGQQYNLFDDSPLNDGKGNPMIFTREVKSIEQGNTLQSSGIRPQKYSFDFINPPSIDNDWVYFRLPDVLLMKAEAILREGAATAGPYGSTALDLVNAIRQHPSRSAGALTNIDKNSLLDERARELWLECWRRQDLIRFGKFLEPFQEKEYVSDPKYLLFPIPNQQLGVNKNLKQNPGY